MCPRVLAHQTSTEFLIDHANMTGYGRMIIETVKNAWGQTTKRTSYTFGADEITQTVTDINPSTGTSTSTTHTFGHDGHGSVTAIFGAAAAIAQVFTYSAYGELLAIHNGAGAFQSLTSNLTSILYNGENIDTRTGLYNFRARWYSPSNGRFERLDPYAGNPNDPFSFHKYGFVHGDPVMGVDPTGLMRLGGLGARISIGTALRGLGIAAVLGTLAIFGYMYYSEMKLQRNGRLGLPGDFPTYWFGRDPKDSIGSFEGVPYLMALYPATLAIEKEFLTLTNGCVGLLNLRLGLRGMHTGTKPWLRIEGTRAIENFDEALENYRSLNHDDRALLYAAQRNPAWPSPTRKSSNSSELKL